MPGPLLKDFIAQGGFWRGTQKNIISRVVVDQDFLLDIIGVIINYLRRQMDALNELGRHLPWDITHLLSHIPREILVDK